MKSRIIKIVCLLSLLVLSNSLFSQILYNGRITDTVKCIGQAGQTYSLYVPASYSESTKWPVILIFDPAGRGVVAVSAFRQASEKYGYILACSHNSRNGPLNNNFTAAGFMLNDLVQRFSIDDKRVYAAGFSGGSRFALALASLNNFIAGVIGCGAGLPNDEKLVPSKKSTFVYYGIAGNKDMNWLEMFELMTYFSGNTSVIPYLRTFDGGHQWPPAEVLREAVEWITLQAMKKKTVTEDPAFISGYAKSVSALVKNLISTGNYYDGVRYLEYAVRDLAGEPSVAELKSMLSSTGQSKEYRDAGREWSRIASREKYLNSRYVSSIQKILNWGTVPDSVVSWWKNEIGMLNTMRDKSNPGNSHMASRLLNFVSILCSEQGLAQFRQKQYNLSGFFFGLCTMSDSENPNNYYNLARSFSALNKRREAIDELNKAIQHGFTLKELIENEPAFNNIRDDEKFKLLTRGMK